MLQNPAFTALPAFTNLKINLSTATDQKTFDATLDNFVSTQRVSLTEVLSSLRELLRDDLKEDEKIPFKETQRVWFVIRQRQNDQAVQNEIQGLREEVANANRQARENGQRNTNAAWWGGFLGGGFWGAIFGFIGGNIAFASMWAGGAAVGGGTYAICAGAGTVVGGGIGASVGSSKAASDEAKNYPSEVSLHNMVAAHTTMV
jgi:hypothetical protein